MIQILQGDCRDVLKTLPSESVHCVVTSPPYWSLRDYGVEGQLGLEKTPEEYVAKMVAVFREVRRVLRKDGTAWVNMGDSYAGGGGFCESAPSTSESKSGKYGSLGALKAGGIKPNGTLKPKDLCGIPWRLAFALQADGWWLRQDIIWHKPNPMPESVTDRCTKAHEYLFLLTKSARYFFDAEAIKEPAECAGDNSERVNAGRLEQAIDAGHFATRPVGRTCGYPSTRNRRSVWTINSEPYPESHFATFPTALVKPCILAGTSAKGCCPKCGAPWERVVEQTPISPLIKGDHIQEPDCWKGTKSRPRQRAEDGTFLPRTDEDRRESVALTMGTRAAIKRMGDGYNTTTTGWHPTCECGETDTVPCTVLDPFGGSFTTCAVALEFARSAIGIELNPKYIELGEKRCNITPGLCLA